jgi:lysophospholipase L1-like esterase
LPTHFSPLFNNALKTERLLVLIAILVVSACRSAPVNRASEVPTTPPHLSVSKFVAYGDSITEGFVQRCPGTVPEEIEPTPMRNELLLAQGRAQPSPTAYPAKLQALLAERYPSQTIRVVNEGMGGEDIEDGVADLPRVLTVNAPEALLLQEGINTLNQKHKDGIPIVVEGLRTMTQEARSRGITVLVATLLPERPGGCRAYDFNEDYDDIIETNVRIRRMAGTEGAILVDLYEAFNGRTATLIGEDGLHPSAAGYQMIARTFFDAIKAHLEN